MRLLLTLVLLLCVPVSIYAQTTRELGNFRGRRGGGIKVEIRTGDPYLSGPSIMCYDEHVIESVHFWGLTRAELEKIRGLIDAAIAEVK